MNNNLVVLKVNQRLNKLASGDFDNIQPWMTVEAFNKGVVSWCRRNLHGLNAKQEGDEQSKRRIDDLQILLKETAPELPPPPPPPPPLGAGLELVSTLKLELVEFVFPAESLT